MLRAWAGPEFGPEGSPHWGLGLNWTQDPALPIATH